MYHVGSKDEVKGRTGFAHFFEHLLLKELQTLKGDWFKIVSSMVGTNNANTTTGQNLLL